MNTENIIEIKESKNQDILDLKLCASEFEDLIEKINTIPKDKIIIFTAWYNKNLLGLLISEDKSQKVDSLTTIIPTSLIHLIHVNRLARNKGIGQELLNFYLEKQKSKGIASVYINIPQKYKKGLKFLTKNNFYQVHRRGNILLFKRNIWNDFGIRDSVLIGEDFHCFLD